MGGLGGAVAAGVVSAAFYLAALAWPTLAPLAAMFVALPGMYLGIRRDTNSALAWLVAAAVAVAVVGQAALALGFVVPFGLTALAVAWGHARGFDFPATAACGVAAWLGGILAALLVAGDLGSVSEAIRDHVARLLDPSAADPAGEAAGAAVVEAAGEIADAIALSFPFLIAISGMAVVLVDLAILRRFGGIFPDAPLRHWRSPDGLVWVLIGAGFGVLAFSGFGQFLALNLLLIVAAVYFLQGLSVVAFFVDRIGFPPVLRPLLYFFLIVQYILALGVTVVGIVDLWADLRRLRPRSADVEPD